ncbi:MAG: hypothetical protein U1E65_18265 [Myxococcota bacterium]
MRILLAIALGSFLGACNSSVAFDRSEFACSAGGPCADDDAGVAAQDAIGSADALAPDTSAADASDAGLHPDAVVFDAMPRDAAPLDAGFLDATSPRDAEVTGNLGSTCNSSLDCSSRNCFDIGSGGARDLRCVRTCGAGADCPPGFGCWNQNGARLCLSAAYLGGGAYANNAGATCATNADCRSTFCDNGHCLEVCYDDSDCQGGRCRLRAVSSTERFSTCDGPGGAGAPGTACTVGTECVSGACNSTTHSCAQLCRNSLSCPADQACVSSQVSTCVVSGTPNCMQANIDVVHVCVARAVGSTPNGGGCTMNENCRSFYCNNGVCSDICTTTADCPSNLTCRPLVAGQAFNVFDFYAGYCLP